MIISRLFIIHFKPQPKNLTAIVKVSSERTIVSENKLSTDTRYFICSKALTADKMLEATRSHWGIENNLHWSIDVIFQEDNKRNRMGNAAVNIAFLRRITLNLLKKEKLKSLLSIKG